MLNSPCLLWAITREFDLLHHLILCGFPSPFFPPLSTLPRKVPSVDNIWMQLLPMSLTNKWPRPLLVIPTAFIHLSIPRWYPPKYHLRLSVPATNAYTPPKFWVVTSKFVFPRVTRHISSINWLPTSWMLVLVFLRVGGSLLQSNHFTTCLFGLQIV